MELKFTICGFLLTVEGREILDIEPYKYKNS